MKLESCIPRKPLFHAGFREFHVFLKKIKKNMKKGVDKWYPLYYNNTCLEREKRNS